MNLQQAIEKFGNREVRNEDELKKLLKPQGRVKPNNGQLYYFISTSGRTCNCIWRDDVYDEQRWKTHGVFSTYEEASCAFEISNAFLDASFDPDWSNRDQIKFYILFDSVEGVFKVNFTSVYTTTVTYFETEEIAQSLIDKFNNEDIKKYIFHIYE